MDKNKVDDSQYDDLVRIYGRDTVAYMIEHYSKCPDTIRAELKKRRKRRKKRREKLESYRNDPFSFKGFWDDDWGTSF